MQQPTVHKRNVDWTTFLFITGTTLASLTIVPAYVYFYGAHGSIVFFGAVFGVATNLSITAGYHRMYAHKAYEASRWIRWVFLAIGAAAFQGSALKWSSDHRRHHANEDSDNDPYSINKGFWYAHVEWLFFKESSDQPIHAPDLANDPAVRWQDKHYPWFATFMGFGFPTIVGALLGSAIEGFLLGGVLRTVLTQNSTFLVNSLAHTWGKRPYSLEISARDNICVAFLTHGEGYHNFHHRFQIDYRNGIRWYHWDPTKWVIQALAAFGQARKLRVVPNSEIQKAKLQIDQQVLQSMGHKTDHLENLKQKIEALHQDLRRLHAEYQRIKVEMKNNSQIKMDQIRRDLKTQMRTTKRELKEQLRRWQFGVQMLRAVPVTA